MAPFSPYQGERITAEIVQLESQAGSLCHYRLWQWSLIAGLELMAEFGFVAQASSLWSDFQGCSVEKSAGSHLGKSTGPRLEM